MKLFDCKCKKDESCCDKDKTKLIIAILGGLIALISAITIVVKFFIRQAKKAALPVRVITNIVFSHRKAMEYEELLKKVKKHTRKKQQSFNKQDVVKNQPFRHRSR